MTRIKIKNLAGLFSGLCWMHAFYAAYIWGYLAGLFPFLAACGFLLIMALLERDISN
jgi:hypothetical protein